MTDTVVPVALSACICDDYDTSWRSFQAGLIANAFIPVLITY